MEHYSDETLSRFLDKELDGADSAAVEQHLEGCEQCRTALAELGALTRAAAEMAELEPPAAVWQRIREQTGFGRQKARPRLWPRLAWFGVPALAAAAVLVVVATGQRPAPEPRPVVAEQPASVPVPEPAQPAAAVVAAGPEPAPRRGRVTVRELAVRPAGAPRPDTEAPAVPGVVFAGGDRQVVGGYLDGLQRATDEAGEAMLRNPGHPRVRLVFTGAQESREQALGRIAGGGGE